MIVCRRFETREAVTNRCEAQQNLSFHDGNYWQGMWFLGKPFLVQKDKEQRTCVRCSWLVPSPGTSPTLTKLLVERVEGQDARFGIGARTGWVDANHTVFLSAEGADTSLVDRQRNCQSDVSNVDATSDRARTSRELIARLSTAGRVTVVGQNGVNQAS